MSSLPARETAGPGPLAGLRVIELGTLLAGPFAGRLLGDMGAEVIKVEAPGKPDPLREWGQARYQGRTLMWPVQARNKKCVTLDLRTERGHRYTEQCIRSEAALDRRAIQFQQRSIDFPLIEVVPRERFCDLPVDVGDGGPDTLAEVPGRIAVT